MWVFQIFQVGNFIGCFFLYTISVCSLDIKTGLPLRHFFLAVIDFVEQIKQTLFSITKEERETIRKKYKGKIPETLTNQFPGRASKETAIGRHKARKQLRTELFPSGKISTHLENSRVITIWTRESSVTTTTTLFVYKIQISLDEAKYDDFVYVVKINVQSPKTIN